MGEREEDSNSMRQGMREIGREIRKEERNELRKEKIEGGTNERRNCTFL